MNTSETQEPTGNHSCQKNAKHIRKCWVIHSRKPTSIEERHSMQPGHTKSKHSEQHGNTLSKVDENRRNLSLARRARLQVSYESVKESHSQDPQFLHEQIPNSLVSFMCLTPIDTYLINCIQLAVLSQQFQCFYRVWKIV